jgi:type IV pilus assembly protein PilX
MKYQSGVVLIISLVMLLLLSIIGISGMAVTILEEAMAANHRDRNLAFQAAEAALRAGERKITRQWFWINSAIL